MPSTSKKQQRLAGADLKRAQEGKPTQTGMSKRELKHFAKTSHKGLPEKARKKS